MPLWQRRKSYATKPSHTTPLEIHSTSLSHPCATAQVEFIYLNIHSYRFVFFLRFSTGGSCYVQMFLRENYEKSWKKLLSSLKEIFHTVPSQFRDEFFWNSSLFVLFFIFSSHLFFMRHKCNIISVK